MKVLQILVLAIMICCFSQTLNAQADCGYDLRLYVRDIKGKTLDNVQIKMGGYDFYYNNQTESYNFWTLLGVGTKYKGLLKVSAKGFDTFEKEIEVSCGFYNYDLRLQTKRTNETAIFKELARISGKVVDANGAIIPNAKVILADKKGITKETITNDYGYYYFVVESGKYSLEFFGAMGFASEKHEDFELSKGNNNLDIVLEIRPCDDCELIVSDPIEKIKNHNHGLII